MRENQQLEHLAGLPASHASIMVAGLLQLPLMRGKGQEGFRGPARGDPFR